MCTTHIARLVGAPLIEGWRVARSVRLARHLDLVGCGCRGQYVVLARRTGLATWGERVPRVKERLLGPHDLQLVVTRSLLLPVHLSAPIAHTGTARCSGTPLEPKLCGRVREFVGLPSRSMSPRGRRSGCQISYNSSEGGYDQLANFKPVGGPSVASGNTTNASVKRAASWRFSGNVVDALEVTNRQAVVQRLVGLGRWKDSVR